MLVAISDNLFFFLLFWLPDFALDDNDNTTETVKTLIETRTFKKFKLKKGYSPI